MTSFLSATVFEEFAAGDIGFAAVKLAMAEALRAAPHSAPQLLRTIEDARERGLVSDEAHRLLVEQVSGSLRLPEAAHHAATAPRDAADVPAAAENTLVRGSGEPLFASQTLIRTAADAIGRSHQTIGRDSAHPSELDKEQDAGIAAGTIVRERYRLEVLVGEGGMGQVWKATDLLGERAGAPRPHVAIKLLGADFENHPAAFVALQREAARAMELAHPNVATVHEFDLDAATGRAFLCMELLKGQPIDELIRLHPRGMEPKAALQIVRELASGLAYAHRKGIVHCDFKPGNAFLIEGGAAKVLDFGIARVVRGSALDDDTFDAGSLGALTSAYATREMLAGETPHAADDVYALGLVAFELFTGRHPYDDRSADEAATLGLRATIPKGASRSDARAIQRAIALERNVRFADAGAFLKALEHLSPWVHALGGLAAVLALVAAYAGYQNYLESRPKVPFESLPPQVQKEFRAAISLGNEAYEYASRETELYLSASELYHTAILQYAEAYSRHPKNAEADEALRRSIDLLEDRLSQADTTARQEAREVLESYQTRFPVLARYEPLTDLIDRLAE